MKRISALFLVLVFVFAAASCSSGKSGTGEASSESLSLITEAENTIKETESVPEATNKVYDDLTGYAVTFIDRNIANTEEEYGPLGSSITLGKGYDMMIDGFEGIHFLANEKAYNDEHGISDKSAVFETLYTSAATEVYPGLATGKTFEEYEKTFVMSPLVYNEDYACFVSETKLMLGSRKATAYLFFFNEDSPCTSLIITTIITTAEKPEFITFAVKEDERANYPILFLGRSAREMKDTYGGKVNLSLDDFDTPVKRTAYFIDSNEKNEETFEEGATVKNVIIRSDSCNILPGIKIGDSAEETAEKYGFKYGYSEESGEDYLIGTVFISGYFTELYFDVENGSITGVS
ncbi:MAG: hypothetical protein IKR90_03705, partial [Clostridia bacterium]|nr:hypothetical protein [Clostridia bacterium]